MNKRIELIYSGRVQGVGFRFTAIRIAEDLGIAGWVKNLQDGSVKIVAEGKEDALNKFLDRIREYFSSNIRNEDLSWQEPSGEFKEFRIAF